MNYKYSICHPDKYDIEYPDKILTKDQVIEMVKNYKWLEILKSMDTIPDDSIYYSPSLDFECIGETKNFCLTASLENNKLEFSLWYNREIKHKPLFGLLPERTKIKVIDKWGFSFDEALVYLHIFLDKQYNKLEDLMNQ